MSNITAIEAVRALLKPPIDENHETETASSAIARWQPVLLFMGIKDTMKVEFGLVTMTGKAASFVELFVSEVRSIYDPNNPEGSIEQIAALLEKYKAML